MRNTLLIGFLTLFLVSILAPAMETMLSENEENVVVLSHTEEEQQESEKKDTSEEKIIPDYFHSLILSWQTDFLEPTIAKKYLNSNHIPEIPLPPPEQLA